MLYIEVGNPSQGAAYQTLYERVAPVSCATRERQAEIVTDFGAVLAWAQGQAPEVLAGYRWAASMILDQIEKRLVQDELNRKIVVALSTGFPKPPAPAGENIAVFAKTGS